VRLCNCMFAFIIFAKTPAKVLYFFELCKKNLHKNAKNDYFAQKTGSREVNPVRMYDIHVRLVRFT
jgi:hypothetical protein